MTVSGHYVIRGGVAGRERLRILARVLRPTTTALFDRLGIAAGVTCLDAGCGGGDVSLDLASRVGPQGRVVGVDLDATKLALARQEAAEAGLATVEFRALDIRTEEVGATFHVVYARFLLSHLADPASAVGALVRHLRPGGLLVVEDVDFSGSFTYPDCQEYRRYCELYCAVVRRRGGDPDIGPRLPLLLADAGLANVEAAGVQPLGTLGEVKLIHAITMENIADTVLADGLANRDEIDAVVNRLREFASDPRTIAGLPRIIQAWGQRP
jgi:SAM-dependent methyltransferase